MEDQLDKLRIVKRREDMLSRPLRRHPFFDAEGRQQRLRPDERALLRHHREDPEEGRWKKIRSFAPDLKCPRCGEMKASSRQWSVKHRTCRSCSARRAGNGCDARDAFVAEDGEWYEVVRAKELREQKGWSQAAVAREVGVSQSYISQIEKNRRRVTPEVAIALIEVLGDEVAERSKNWRVDPDRLRRAATQSGRSVREICRRADVSRTHWYRLVGGSSSLVTQRLRDALVAALA